MRARGGDPAVVHHKDQIGILHRGHTLCDNDLGGVWYVGTEARTDECVGLGVHGAGGVVENEDLWLFEKGSGNAKSLLLTARHVGAALFDLGIIAVGEGTDEIIRLCQTASLDQLLVGGVFVTPTKIFLDGAREEKILLKHHGDRVAKRLDIVIAHVHAAYLNGALGGIVQTGNELNQTGFTGARTAENSHGHARLDVQIDVGKRVFFRLCRVFEADILKVDGAVSDLGHGVLGALQVGNLVENLADTARRLGGHGDNNVDHRDHHQRHEDLHTVGEHSGDLTHANAAFCQDQAGADDEHEDHVKVHAELHQRCVESYNALGAGEIGADAVRLAIEFFLFIVLAGEALDHAHGTHVFLNGLVESVVLAEHRAEGGHCLAADGIQSESEHGDDHHKGHGKHAAHNVRHDAGKNEHQGASDSGADDHHKRHLHVGHVGGHTGDQGRGGEFVDVDKREGLNFLEDVVSEVFGEARGRLGAGEARHTAATQRDDRHERENQSCLCHTLDAVARVDAVDQIRRDKGDQTLNNRFHYNENERDESGFFVLSYAFCQLFEHVWIPFRRSFGFFVTFSL